MNDSKISYFQEISAFFLAEVFLAIEYIHEQGLIIRDVKPENIMLDIDGHVRLIDFGLSKIGVTDKISTFTHTSCGTSAYMVRKDIKSIFNKNGAKKVQKTSPNAVTK